MYVPAASAELGVSVTLLDAESYDTVAATDAPPDVFSVTVEPLIDVASIAREKTACTVVPLETPVAPLAGVLLVTAGGTGMISIAAISGLSTFATALIPSVPSVITTPLIVLS